MWDYVSPNLCVEVCSISELWTYLENKVIADAVRLGWDWTAGGWAPKLRSLTILLKGGIWTRYTHRRGEERKRRTICKLRRKSQSKSFTHTLRRNHPRDTLILNSQPSELGDSKLLLFGLSSWSYLATAAPANEHHHFKESESLAISTW